MKQKRRKYRHTFRFSAPHGKTFNVCVPMRSAKTTVKMTRTERDVIAGKPGIAVACANFECVMRLGETIFPHPVYFAEFTKTRCYIVTALDKDGQPKRCICYSHDDGEWIERFDRPGGKLALIRSGASEREVTLHPPPNQDLYRPGRARGKNDGTRSKAMPRGANKRAIDAGWIPPTA